MMRKIFAAIAGVSMLGFAAGANASEVPTTEQTDGAMLLTASQMDDVTAGWLRNRHSFNNQNVVQTAAIVNTQLNIAVLAHGVYQSNNAYNNIRQNARQSIR